MFDILSKIHGIITNIKSNIIHPFKSDLHLYLINTEIQFDEVLLEIKGQRWYQSNQKTFLDTEWLNCTPVCDEMKKN